MEILRPQTGKMIESGGDKKNSQKVMINISSLYFLESIDYGTKP